jgi:hypothetical protein
MAMDRQTLELPQPQDRPAVGSELPYGLESGDYSSACHPDPPIWREEGFFCGDEMEKLLGLNTVKI